MSSNQTRPIAPVPTGMNTDKLKTLETYLSADSLKKQLPAIRELAALGPEGEGLLVTFVRSRMEAQNEDAPTAAHGSAYQYLYQGVSDAAKAFIEEEFPEGLVCPQSAQGLDYSDLQMLLIKRQYEEADKLTNLKLCALAGESAIARKWVYFTDVEKLPALDLMAMDIMWGLYSENKFGWSKQHELWTRLGKDWERLWPQLNWKNGNTWTRYPNEFIWDVSAPVGHMPLSNQLRGVRTMNALLSHPVWS
ncbi:MAG: GUN4 N-terminal ARM-like repeat domain-containing protein [Cyanobacteria bacterium J06598_3]